MEEPTTKEDFLNPVPLDPSGPEAVAPSTSIDPVRRLSSIRQKAASEDSQILEMEKSFGINRAEPNKPVEHANQEDKNSEADIRMMEDALHVSRETIGHLVARKTGAYAKQAVGGVSDSVQNMWNLAVDVADWGENYLAKQGIGPGDIVEKFHADISPVSEGQSFDESLVRSVTGFLVPFMGWSKVLRAGKAVGAIEKFAKFTAAGAITDFTVTDPTKGRLSDLIEKNPSLRNPISGYLASDPTDTVWDSRMKTTLEGMGLGMATGAIGEGLFTVLKHLRARWSTNTLVKEAERSVPPPPSPEMVSKGADLPLSAETKAAQEAVSQGQKPTEVIGVKQVPGQGTMLDVIKEAKSTEPQVAGVTKPMTTLPDKAGNIRLDKYDLPDRVKSVMAQTDEVFSEQMSKARGEPVNAEDIAGLADDLNMSVRDLVNIPQTNALNKAQIFKLRQTIAASSEIVFESASKARGGSMADKAMLLQALDAHRAIQARLAGATSEWGRSGLAFKMEVAAAGTKEKQRILKELIDSAGGEDTLTGIAEKLINLKTPREISQVLQRTKWESFKDATFSVYINSLLSGPRTHINNFLTNTSAVAGRISEHAGSAVQGKLRGSELGERITFGQIGAEISALVNGVGDSFQLAAKAFKTGKPIMDRLTKVDTALSQSVANLSDGNQSVIAQAFGPLASFVSTPTRALMAADEFFKSLHHRMSIHQTAILEAEKMVASGNLKAGKEFSEKVASLIANPTEPMVSQAITDMRYYTFTKELTGASRSIDQTIKKIPPVRVIMPFVKTNLNLLEYQIERSPFGYLMPNVRAEIAKGGIARDQALSKMLLGSSAMAYGGYLTASGIITGSGPANPDQRKLREESGWQPYSVKVGDKYYRYDKMDPFGGLLATAADTAEIITQLSEHSPGDEGKIVAATAGIIADHLTPNFLVDSFGSFAEAVNDKTGKKWERFLENFATSFVVPSIARTATRMTDTTKRDTSSDPRSPHPYFQEMLNKMKANIPGLSDSLPPQINRFGEVIDRWPGYGLDALSPVYTSQFISSPGRDELMRLGMSGPIMNPEPRPGEEHLRISWPDRILEMGRQQYKLNPQEYAVFSRLAAGIGLKAFHGKTLIQTLDDTVKGGFKDLGPFRNNDEDRKLQIKKIFSMYERAAVGEFFQASQKQLPGVSAQGMYQTIMEQIKTRSKKVMEKPGKPSVGVQ